MPKISVIISSIWLKTLGKPVNDVITVFAATHLSRIAAYPSCHQVFHQRMPAQMPAQQDRTE